MDDSRRLQPTSVRAPHGAAQVEITWADGVTSRIPNEILRGYCPCAGCQGHSGTIRFISGASHEIRNVGQVGNYALALTWGDAHSSGIYAFRFLRRLGDLVAAHGASLPQVKPELERGL